MPNLPTSLPAYPHLARFSDPSRDFRELRDELTRLAPLPPDTLSAEELCFLFNSWCPADSFEEMAPYVPRALALLRSEKPDEWCGELAHMLLVWCYVEEDALRHATAFCEGLQAALHELFERWTSTLMWMPREGGGFIVTFADHIENLLRWGAFAAEQRETPFPWLRPQHYLAELYTLESIEHAVLALWVSDREENILPEELRLGREERLQAMKMVSDWLTSSASREEAAIWRSTLEHHQQELAETPQPATYEPVA